MQKHESQTSNLISEARARTLAFAIRLLGGVAVVVLAILLAVVGITITLALIIGFLAIPNKTDTFLALAKGVIFIGLAILGAAATAFLVSLAFGTASFLRRRPDDLPPLSNLPTHVLLEELRRQLNSERIIDGTLEQPGKENKE